MGFNESANVRFNMADAVASDAIRNVSFSVTTDAGLDVATKKGLSLITIAGLDAITNPSLNVTTDVGIRRRLRALMRVLLWILACLRLGTKYD